MSAGDQIRVHRDGERYWIALPEELSKRWRVQDGDALDYEVTQSGLQIRPAGEVDEETDRLLELLIRENEDVLRRLAQ